MKKPDETQLRDVDVSYDSSQWLMSGEYVHSRASALLQEHELQCSTKPTVKISERYEKIALIGEGGMGRVWLGWDAVIERNVAIKEPHHDASQAVRARLEREVMITAKLDHPGVVAVHDLIPGEDQRCSLFIMALVHGQTLATLVQRARHTQDNQPAKPLVRHILQACEIMGHAHQRGILHRDLTPCNVIIEENGTVRVIDWGLAVTFEEGRQAPSAAGTPGYMSPEQRSGSRLDATSDVFGLGGLLYTVLHGGPPTPHRVQRLLQTERPTPLDAICARAMHPNPTQRYCDALAMAADLNRWFEGERIEALEMNSWQVVRWMLRRYRRTLGISALVLCVLFVTLGSSAWFAQQEAERAREAEHVALTQKHRANAASLLAEHEASEARQASQELALNAAVQAWRAGDILQTRELLGTAREIGEAPRTRGLQMQLDLVPEPVLHHQRTLAFCAGRILLTPNPEVQLCSMEGNLFEAWHGDKRLWRIDLTPELTRLNPYNRIKSWRIEGDALVITATLRGAMRVALQSGEVELLADTLVRFGSLQHADIIDFEDHYWVDDTTTASPCGASLLMAYRDARQAHYLCQDSLWRQAPGEQVKRVDIQGHARPHYMVYLDVLDEYWFASSDGSIWPQGRYTDHVTLGAPIKEIFAIPRSSYIVVRDWGGTWRVLEARQGDWVASFDAQIDELRATHAGYLQSLDEGMLKVWELPMPQVMRRYRGGHGMTDVAWSEDGTTLGATSGGGLLHYIRPYEHTFANPLIAGRDVAKSLTPMQGGGFVAVSSQMSTHDLRGLIHYDFVDGAWYARSLRKDARHVITGCRVERMKNNHVVYISISRTLMHDTYQGEDQLFKRTMLGDYGAFHDLDVDGARHTALAVGKNLLKFIRYDGKVDDVQAPRDVNYGTLSGDGRYALIRRNEILIFSREHKELHRIQSPDLTAIEWRDGTDQILTGHLDGTLRVWQAQTAELIAEVSAHQGLIASIECSPDQALVATASWDTTVRLTSLDALN